MAYRLRRDDASLEASLRRIAADQFEKALESIELLGQTEAIHEVRRRCKKLRGLIRLARTAFADFEAEDEAIRDIGRPLSGLRDARVVLDTFDKVVGDRGDHSKHRRLGRIRMRLEEERAQLLAKIDADRLLDETRARLAEARIRSTRWALDGDGWEVVGAGVAISYDKARATAAEAFATRDPVLFHHLRKHVRYHWCHTRLLREFWPAEMRARAVLADNLADVLGEQHDIAVFGAKLSGDPRGFGAHGQLAQMLSLAGGYNTRLEARSEKLAGRLLAETTDALAAHWHALWDVWRRG